MFRFLLAVLSPVVLFAETNAVDRIVYTERVTSVPQLRGTMSPGGLRCTERDVADLAALGATVIRFQLNGMGDYLRQVGRSEEYDRADVPAKLAIWDEWLSKGLERFDQAIGWARKHGMRFVLDLHVPPGDRGLAYSRELSMFFDRRLADHFVETWRMMATRYRGNGDVIFGYDLVNEPLQDHEALPGCANLELQKRAAEAIRAVDPDTTIIVECGEFGNPEGFKDMKPIGLTNVVYSCHMYRPHQYTHQKPPTNEASVATLVPYPAPDRRFDRKKTLPLTKEGLRGYLRPVRDFQRKYGARIFIGEFSAPNYAPGADRYMADCIDIFNEYGWDWAFHVWRENRFWNVEKTFDFKTFGLHSTTNNARYRVLMDGFRGRDVVRPAVVPFVERGQIPGLVSILVNGDREVVESVGWADAEKHIPMSPDRTYMICSQTKGVCGVAMAMLIEEGKVRLDDPVERYLPKFGSMFVNERMKDGSRRLRKAVRKMTLRHLLTHTSGLPFESPSKDALGATGVPLSVQAAEAAVQPLRDDPGARFAYSNWGMDVAARVVEVVSGKGFDVFLQERVFGPLGMDDTTFNPTDEQLSRAMRLYRVAPGKPCARIADTPMLPVPRNGPTVHPGAGAGLWTTPADFARFYKMLLNRGVGENGVRVLREQTVRELLEKSQIPEGAEAKKGYSLGFHVDGRGWYGHGGAYHTNCRINPDRRLLKLLAQQLEGDEPPEWPWRVAWEKATCTFLYAKESDDGNAFVGLKSEQPGISPYKDPNRPVAERVRDLVARMTPEEKCAQIGLVVGFNAYVRGKDGRLEVDPAFARNLRERPTGQVYGLYRSDTWSKRDWTTGVKPEEAPEIANRIQRILVEETRLGIPTLFVAEAPHGLMELGQPVYPTGPGLGASFDADLLYRIGVAKGEAARARGEMSMYAPIVDIARDPRWSRSEESFGELPEHVSQLALAEFKGIMSTGVDACMKHYIGAGSADGGQHTMEIHVGLNELQNVQLRPFRRLIRAGAREIMCTYNNVDGEHCSSSAYLLDEILRGQLGFTGFVNGDAGSIQGAAGRRMCKDVPHAAARALKAGCDTEFDLGDLRAGDLFKSAYDAKLLTDADLDKAVMRVLTLKFELGLFERPYAPPTDHAYRAKNDALTLEAARKAMTLLKNGGCLPLRPGAAKRIAVIGPQAGDRVMNQFGMYTATQRPEEVSTVLDGVRKFAGEGVRVDFALGCRIRNPDRSGFAAAERLAAESDVTVLALGGSSSVYGKFTLKDEWAGASVITDREDPDNDKDGGEGTDRCELVLSGVQMDLFRAVRAKAKKLIVVLVTGRAVVVDELVEKSDAVLLAWYPGSHGGDAVGETLFGLNNPSGRLPVSFPHAVGQLPITSDHMSARRPRYIDGDPNPAFRVGYGLSYTTFRHGKLNVKGRDLSVEVTNAGKTAGEESVLFYATVYDTGVQRPCRELVGFRRVALNPGEVKTVSLSVDPEALGRYDRNGRFVPCEGKVEYRVQGPTGEF